MANQNEALQAGFFTSRDLGVSKPARFDALHFKSDRLQRSRNASENNPDKQEFAKVYSRSLQKQTQTADRKAHDSQHKPERFSTAKSERLQPSNQHKTREAGQYRRDASSSGARLESGNNLPPADRAHGARRARVEASSTQEKADDQQTNTVDQQPSPIQQAESLEQSSQNAVSFPGQDACAAERLLSTQVPAGKSESISTTVLPSDQVNNTAAVPVVGSESLSPQQQAAVAELAEVAEPEESVKTAIASGPLHSQVRAAVDKTFGQSPNSFSDRSYGAATNTGLANSGQSMTEAFADSNNAANSDESGDDPKHFMSRETGSFKDRLFALAQQNSNAGSVPGNELKELLMRHSNLPSNTAGDSPLNDFNIHASREPIATTRIPGSPMQVLSPMLQMSSTPDHKGWSNEVGQRVVWMASTDLQQAQLQLNPKHLGPLEVKISMTSDQQINVSFLAHSTHVKDALDQAMPRLREVFDQSGLNLNDVTVQQESRNQNRDHHHTSPQTPMEDSLPAENMLEDTQMAQFFQSHSVSSNIVDFYA
jgi:flagellar hook-length control protein FliK